MSDDPLPSDLNPYASPDCAEHSPTDVLSTEEVTRLVWRFRAQSLALACGWILIGALLFIPGIMIMAAGQSRNSAGFAILIFVGGICLVAGAGILWKQVWAIWLGIALGYLGLVVNLLLLSLCNLIIAGALVFFGHRILGYASQMRRLGIPLSFRPPS